MPNLNPAFDKWLKNLRMVVDRLREIRLRSTSMQRGETLAIENFRATVDNLEAMEVDSDNDVLNADRDSKHDYTNEDNVDEE